MSASENRCNPLVVEIRVRRETGELKKLYLTVTTKLSKAEVQMASRDRQHQPTKTKQDLTIYPMARDYLIWQRLRFFSSSTGLELLEAFSSEAWLRGLPLRQFGT
ncbi:hypothetical protein F8M41_012197 [Gigaspora margarita]|uniref:Uncharacterized protein n=1 Tax=Gigaspora margarita TaxID=4874 RepID=A0A8H4AT91_GIGMA|nr:hypothetical protein F8M41_012197 [Gigaspora margarita]